MFHLSEQREAHCFLTFGIKVTYDSDWVNFFTKQLAAIDLTAGLVMIKLHA